MRRKQKEVKSGGTGEAVSHWDQHPDAVASWGFSTLRMAELDPTRCPLHHSKRSSPQRLAVLVPQSPNPPIQEQPGSSKRQLESSCANTAKEDFFPKAIFKFKGKNRKSGLWCIFVITGTERFQSSATGPSRPPPQSRALPWPFPPTLPARILLASSNTILHALFIPLAKSCSGIIT